MKTFISAAELPIADGVGTVGYTVLNSDGSTLVARTTSGIIQLVTDTDYGIYMVNAEVADDAEPATVVWDDHNGNATQRLVNEFSVIAAEAAVSDAMLPIEDGVGFVGYTVYDETGAESIVRSLVGVSQSFTGDGFGIYQASVPVGELLDAVVIWDDGEGNYAFDRVAGEATPSVPDDDPENPTPQKTIRFCIIQDGAIYQPTVPPVLGSPSNGYGVAKLDGTVVLAYNTPFTNNSGIYTKSFDDASSDKFRYYVHVLGRYVEATTELVNSSMLALGRYTDSWEIARIFGPDNMHLWLSLPGGDQDEPVDYAIRAWQYIADAEAQMDAGLSGSYFAGDGLVGDFSGGVPRLISQLAATLAGVMMYEARGVVDVNPQTGQPQHRLRWHRNKAEETIKKLRNGVIFLDAGQFATRIPSAYVSDPVDKVYDPSLIDPFSLFNS